ncbi:MAG: hypothetical protein M1833_003108 [Piccolia ochrophora]|nr:MAG: hypothetical protein M1833_003108 [Piccolia ochrophora]
MEASRYADSPPPGAAAPIASPSPQPTADATDPPSSDPSAPTMSTNPQTDGEDQFAQTRGPDDLFDDDFTPIPQAAPQPQPPTGPRNRGGPANRNQRAGPRGGQGGRSVPNEDVPQPEKTPQADDIDAQPDGPAREERRAGAVRGDRSGTGGVKKPKLSESELTARLADMSLKSAAREAAHRRAEADEASFREREHQDTVKRLAERQNRQRMDEEREKNRMRKLKSVGGREWDLEKGEDDGRQGEAGRGSGFRRGAYGGVARDERVYEDGGGERGGYDGGPRGARGRGGRGRGRGRGGRGRGSLASEDHGGERTPDPTADNDFPALPASQTETQQKQEQTPAAQTTSPATNADLPPMSPPAEGSSWAEQVERAPPATEPQEG